MGFTAVAMLGAAAIGGRSQRKAAKSAAAANLEQQRRALEFQREQAEKAVASIQAGRGRLEAATGLIGTSRETLLAGQVDASQYAKRRAIEGVSRIDADLLRQGYSNNSSLAMQAKAAMYRNVMESERDLVYKYASDIAGTYQTEAQFKAQEYQSYAAEAAAYTNQSYPMVMTEAPQGNWAADYAKLAGQIGDAMSASSAASSPAPTTSPYATYEGYGGQTYYSDPVAQQSRPLSSFPGNTTSPF